MFTFETLVFILLCISVILSTHKNNGSSILSKDQTGCLRGVFCFFIIINHISKEYDVFDNIYSVLSIAVVSSFFFISGYGLMKGYLSKENYQRHFIIHRFIKLVLPYIITTIIYWVYYIIIGEKISLLNVVIGIFKLQPIVTYSWFILILFIQYIIFYLIMVISKQNKKAFSIIALFLTLVSFVLLVVNKYVSYCMNVYFGLGIMFATYEKETSTFLKKYRNVLIIGCVLVIVISLIGMYRFFANELLMNILFIVLVLLYSQKYIITNSFFAHLGKISLEIYMFHGLAKMIVRRFLSINMFIDDAVIMILAYLMAVIMHGVFSCISKRISINE